MPGVPSVEVIIGIIVICASGLCLGACLTIEYYFESEGYPINKLSGGYMDNKKAVIFWCCCFALLIVAGFAMIYYQRT